MLEMKVFTILETSFVSTVPDFYEWVFILPEIQAWGFELSVVLFSLLPYPKVTKSYQFSQCFHNPSYSFVAIATSSAHFLDPHHGTRSLSPFRLISFYLILPQMVGLIIVHPVSLCHLPEHCPQLILIVKALSHPVLTCFPSSISWYCLRGTWHCYYPEPGIAYFLLKCGFFILSPVFCLRVPLFRMLFPYLLFMHFFFAR